MSVALTDELGREFTEELNDNRLSVVWAPELV